jgi:hypothetical protein
MRKPLTIRTASEILAMKFPDEEKVVIDAKANTVTLNFDYPYEVDLDRIKNERSLLAWTLHLSEKVWMNAERLNYFITKVGKHKGFNIYGLN